MTQAIKQENLNTCDRAQAFVPATEPNKLQFHGIRCMHNVCNEFSAILYEGSRLVNGPRRVWRQAGEGEGARGAPHFQDQCAQ